MILGTERIPSRAVVGRDWIRVTTLVRCARCPAYRVAAVTVGADGPPVSEDWRVRALVDAYQVAARDGWTILADTILCPACAGAVS